uniref:Uncharacterized protein LOC108037204 n=1 Tax=Drosophila rhopaloa TaxID=1041015 RepID=A0A6P4DUJ1_DRORH
MNPACRLNLEGTECQQWMNEVCAHCAQLLPSAEQAELWDKWWADDLPAPFKNRVNLMSAYDCHKLRREVARQVAAHGDQERYEAGGNHVWWSVCRGILLVLVLLSVLIAMVCALRILCNAVRRWSLSTAVECSPPAKVTPEKRKPPPPPSTPTDVETPPQEDPCKPSKQPKSFISFGRSTDPRTRYGPYKHQKLLKTECQPAEAESQKQPYPALKKPKPKPASTPRPAEKSGQHAEQQSTKNKSATK